MEFAETYYPNGTFTAVIRADIPAGYFYRITVEANGSARAKSRAFGKGSIRYHTFANYQQAQQAACKWAARKIAEERIGL